METASKPLGFLGDLAAAFAYSTFRGLQEQAHCWHSGEELPRTRPCSSPGTTACLKDRPRIFWRCHHPRGLPAAQGGGSARLILPSLTDATAASGAHAQHVTRRHSASDSKLRFLRNQELKLPLSPLGKQLIVSPVPSAEPVCPHYGHARDAARSCIFLGSSPACDLSGAAFLATA